MRVDLLHYRSWQGKFLRPFWAIWPICRLALRLLFRRKLFWALYAISLFIFLMFFFGAYLLDWAITHLPQTPPIQIGQFRPDPRRMIEELQKGIPFFNGSNLTFEYFFIFQSSMVVVTLALVGSLLVGNDYVYGSVPFFLAKPISRWHYILGKCLAVGIVVNMLTTLPAVCLFLQRSSGDWDYLVDPNYFVNMGKSGPAGIPLLLGILGYGAILTTVLSIVLVAMASWLRRTMPLVMVWTSLFLFLRIVAGVLVNRLHYDERWRLMDLWNNIRLVGCAFLGFQHDEIDPSPQPEILEASIILVVVCSLCLIYLNLKTRAVEIVK